MAVSEVSQESLFSNRKDAILSYPSARDCRDADFSVQVGFVAKARRQGRQEFYSIHEIPLYTGRVHLTYTVQCSPPSISIDNTKILKSHPASRLGEAPRRREREAMMGTEPRKGQSQIQV